MSEPDRTEQTEGVSQPGGGRQFGGALLAGLVVALILAGGVYLWMRHANGSATSKLAPLPMSDVEQAYAKQVQFTDVEMSRAENFLHQQVTYILGNISNTGARKVGEMEVTLEFHDLSQKVVLREVRRLYGEKERPLAASEKREFQLTFESIPPGWDLRPPAFLITGLQLQ